MQLVKCGLKDDLLFIINSNTPVPYPLLIFSLIFTLHLPWILFTHLHSMAPISFVLTPLLPLPWSITLIFTFPFYSCPLLSLTYIFIPLFSFHVCAIVFSTQNFGVENLFKRMMVWEMKVLFHLVILYMGKNFSD